MKPHMLVAVALASLSLSTPCSYTDAAEIHIFSVPALRPVFSELGPQFEHSSGHTLLIKYTFVPAAMREIAAGQEFDLAILEPTAIDDLTSQGKIAASTRRNIGYVGLGVGSRMGASKPDIRSSDAFKRALLDAKSIAYQPDTGSGRYFAGLLHRLGIAAEIQNKLKPKPGGEAIASVASGEVELVVISIPALIATPGVDLVGPLPSELQSYIRFEAGIGTAANDPNAATALLDFLTSAPIASALKAKGMEPGAP